MRAPYDAGARPGAMAPDYLRARMRTESARWGPTPTDAPSPVDDQAGAGRRSTICDNDAPACVKASRDPARMHVFGGLPFTDRVRQALSSPCGTRTGRGLVRRLTSSKELVDFMYVGSSCTAAMRSAGRFTDDRSRRDFFQHVAVVHTRLNRLRPRIHDWHAPAPLDLVNHDVMRDSLVHQLVG